MAARSPFWNRNPVAPPAPARARPRGRTAARALALAAAVAGALGLLGVPFPWDESIDADVIVLADTRTAEMEEAARALGERLRGQPGVAGVEVRTGIGPRELAIALDDLADPARRGRRPRVALLLNPHGNSDVGAWADRAGRLRAAGVAVGVIAAPPATVPGAVVTLPTRVPPKSGPKDETGGTFAVQVRNAGGLGEVRLKLVAHGAELRADKLKAALTRFPRFPVEPEPRGAAVTAPSLPFDRLKLPPPALGGDAAGMHLMLFPNQFSGTDAVVGPGLRGLEVVASADGRVLSRDYRPTDAHPPPVLYVPLAAFPKLDRSAGFVPALPQVLGERDSRDRLAWNLLRAGDGNGGLTVFWPKDRKQPAPGPGDVLEHLPGDKGGLDKFRAIVLDASTPPGLARDVRPTQPAEGDGWRLDWATHAYSGGVLFPPADQPDTGYVSQTEWTKFLEALKEYWAGGGTVVLVGGAPQCWDDDQTAKPTSGALTNLRGVVRYLDPELAANFQAAAPPRRVVFAVDVTNSATRAGGSGRFVTLPPLSDRATRPNPAPADYDAQVRQFVGAPPPAGRAPSAADLADAAVAGLGLEADAAGVADPELRGVFRGLLAGSKAEFGVQLALAVAGPFTHPGLQAEYNGRPLYRRGYPAVAAGADPARGFAHPFAPQYSSTEKLDRPIYRDRFASLFDLLSGKPADVPWQKADALLQGVKVDRLTAYLAATTPAGTGDDDVVFAVGDAAASVGDPAGKTWPLYRPDQSDSKRYPRAVPSGAEKAPARRGQHLLLLGPAPSGATPAASFFTGAPPVGPDDWWTATPAPGTDDPWRLLHLGRGRYQKLLTAGLARDVQSVPAAVPADLSAVVRALDGHDSAEATDALRAVVAERLRLSFRPAAYPDGPRWRVLARAGGGSAAIPVLAAAAGSQEPGHPPGRLVVALFDPGHEARLYHARGAALGGWEDFSAPTEWVPSSGGTSTLRTLDLGFRLKVTEVGADGFAVGITAHRVVGSALPPVIADAVSADHPPVAVSARLYPALGLAGAPGVPFTADGVPTALAAGGTTIFRLRPDSSWLAAWGGPPGAGPFPHGLPPLIEFRLTWSGGSTAVYAPVPPGSWPVQGQADYFSGPMAYAPPATQAIDLALELFARRPPLRVSAYPDGETIRVLPDRPGVSLPEPAAVSVAADDGTDLTAGVRFDRTLPGQLFLRPSGAWAGYDKAVKVRVKRADGSADEYPVWLPGPPGPDEPARARPLVPSAAGGALPTPEGVIADTLATGTRPPTVADPPADGWSAAGRGVLVAPFGPEQVPLYESFATRFVAERTSAPHARGFFLLAAGLLAAGLFIARVGAR